MSEHSTDNSIYTPGESWKIFDRISRRYDFLNRFLSFGIDASWRKTLLMYLPKRENLEILDLATGTGDVIITIAQNNENIKSVHGIDLSKKMLAIGRAKIANYPFKDKIQLQTGDISKIPFNDNRFDCDTMAFGIRNSPDVKATLKEIFRTLKPSGRALILEFSQPQNPLIRLSHRIYLKCFLPVIGALFSGNFKAYRYLSSTILSFPYGEEFCQLMRGAGFKNVRANPLTFGVATIYQGDK